MAARQEPGCDDLRWPGDPQLVERALVERFMPVLCFAPAERFFPVDLRSAVRASSLWRAASPGQPQCSRAAGDIAPTVDLPGTTGDHFTTIASFDPASAPAPQLDEVLQRYADGTVGARLTIYATVCSAHRVPNAHLFRGATPALADITSALQEGVIINYYMYFPACDAAEIQSEGDWSGISLLLRARPSPAQAQHLNDPAVLDGFLPVVAAYYRKTLDGAPPSPALVAANGGIRRWSDVDREPDPADRLPTHPVVYVSRGRHNCYFRPMSGPASLGSPWSSPASSIEDGKATPGPAVENALSGAPDDDVKQTCLVLSATFPPFGALWLCATGCHPMDFDASGLPGGYVDGQDTTSSSTAPGDKTVQAPSGDPYPPEGPGPGGTPPPPRQLAVKLEYVDLLDAETAAWWRYPGAWGAATQVSATYPGTPQAPHTWCALRGVRRPALGAWFLWNLFVDSLYGCGGKASVTPVPATP